MLLRLVRATVALLMLALVGVGLTASPASAYGGTLACGTDDRGYQPGVATHQMHTHWDNLNASCLDAKNYLANRIDAGYLSEADGICVQIAFDWANFGANGYDTRIVRVCNSNGSMEMPSGWYELGRNNEADGVPAFDLAADDVQYALIDSDNGEWGTLIDSSKFCPVGGRQDEGIGHHDCQGWNPNIQGNSDPGSMAWIRKANGGAVVWGHASFADSHTR